MGRAGKPKPVADSQDNDHKENITWAGNLDTLSAFQTKEGYQEGWKPGRKVTCRMKWAKALGMDHLDRDGTKTKAHVEQLVNRWKATSKMMTTGWSDKTRKIKKDGQWVSLEPMMRTIANRDR